MEVIEKLSTLFPYPNGSEILNKLVDIGFIAGGSVVWALLDIKDKPSDIDLFVNGGDQVKKIIELLEPYTLSVDQYVYSNSSCSIVDVNLVDGPQVQIVCVNSGFKDTIDLFDMDYVQCGVHKDLLYRSEACIQAHLTRTISLFTELPSKKRLEKALRKGFKVPYFVLDIPNRWSSENGVSEGRSQFKTVYELDKPMINHFNDASIKNDTEVEYFAIQNRDKSKVYSSPKLIGIGEYEGTKVFELDVGVGKPLFATHISREIDDKIHIVSVDGIVEENVGYLPI